jgi:uncharacterized protein YceK
MRAISTFVITTVAVVLSGCAVIARGHTRRRHGMHAGTVGNPAALNAELLKFL